MPRDVNGNYVPLHDWVSDAAGYTELSPEKFREQDGDIAGAINDIGDPDALLKWAPEGTNPASVPPGTISEDAEGRPLIKGSGAVWSTAVADAVDHAARTDNPHGVTAAQVGLGNVNNTSDADKPISTAQAAALDALGASVASALGTVEAIQSLAGASAFGTLMFATRAELEAALNYTQNTGAWVYGDAIAANNGTYVKEGAAGVGSWTRASDLPFSMIPLTVTGGTADAIQAASTIPVPATDRAALLTLVPNASNTGAVTITINGAAPIAVTDSTGAPLAETALAGGVPVMAMVFAGALRLIGESDLAASVSAAAASRLAAEAAASTAAAEAALSGAYAEAVEAALVASLPGKLDDAANVIANAHLAMMPPRSFKANNTGTSDDPVDITVTQAASLLGFDISGWSGAGHMTLPPMGAMTNGVLIQWGQATGNVTVTFPVAFSATPISVMATGYGGPAQGLVSAQTTTWTTTTFFGVCYQIPTAGGAPVVYTTNPWNWIAIGAA